MKTLARPNPARLAALLPAIVLLAGCQAAAPANSDSSEIANDNPAGAASPKPACQVSEPVWAKPPEDPAVDGHSELGYYYVNADRSIWASAWWTRMEEGQYRAIEQGIKVGWFRPAGAELQITGRRLDGPAAALDAHIPCCYPTRFQASGLAFPSAGCWEVTAMADESTLSFIVQVYP